MAKDSDSKLDPVRQYYKIAFAAFNERLCVITVDDPEAEDHGFPADGIRRSCGTWDDVDDAYQAAIRFVKFEPGLTASIREIHGRLVRFLGYHHAGQHQLANQEQRALIDAFTVLSAYNGNLPEQTKSNAKGRRRTRRPSRKPQFRALTDRQNEVMAAIAESCGNITKVSKKLGITRKTVRQHHKAGMRKLLLADLKEKELGKYNLRSKQGRRGRTINLGEQDRQITGGINGGS